MFYKQYKKNKHPLPIVNRILKCIDFIPVSAFGCMVAYDFEEHQLYILIGFMSITITL